eukprot:CAMPEP_0202703670 /NCGR_PEP_ID=MMETSP1385-20130828/16486_1 /ASSEMBLY_ACC=CAM_ASM_000861 /TAXON_ID=933848 /ORGANISM="Elphidium margaritaceum" /LENGTH=297 /DNA_ID=CAMNT_0049361561 /DNA_START=34 /DNA_END=927 /DNA_ORIENTATION=+
MSAVQFARRVSTTPVLNRLCAHNYRTLSTLNNSGKYRLFNSIVCATHNNNHSRGCSCHICSSKSAHSLTHVRSMSATQQDKDNDNDQPPTNNTEGEQSLSDEESVEESDEDSTEQTNQQIEELQSKVEELQRDLKKYQDAVARSHADIINIQNMGKKDVESAKKFAIKSFSKDMLNVADALDGCIKVVEQHLNEYKDTENEVDENIKSVIDGVKLTQTTLMDTFGRHGITKIVSLHQQFDPNVHEALFMQPTDEHPQDTVVTVVCEGYTIKDAVLRAAKVGVSKSAPAAPSQSDNNE